MNLSDYIKGIRKGKVAHQIEKDSMQDPFLYEALEGFDSVKEDHTSRINEIQARIAIKKTKYRKDSSILKSIAASIIIILAVGGYFLIDTHKTDLYAQEAANIDMIDIYVPQIFYEENIAIIAQKNTALAKNFRPTINRFSIDEFTDTTISQSEMDILSSDILANNDTPITIYMPNEEKYNNKTKLVAHVMPKPESNLAEVEPIVVAEAKTDNIDLSADSNINLLASKNLERTQPSQSLELNESVVIENRAVAKETLAGSMNRSTLDRQAKATTSNISKQQSIILPQPIIGYKKYDAYLQSSLKRPTDDICKDKKGKVLLEFSIDDTGKPYDIIVKYSLCGTCDKEAIRLVESGPKWTIGSERVTIKVEF